MTLSFDGANLSIQQSAGWCDQALVRKRDLVSEFRLNTSEPDEKIHFDVCCAQNGMT